MDEFEIKDAEDAVFYMANEVIHEYHGMPLVHRADFARHAFFVQLNGMWFQFSAARVTDGDDVARLEDLVP